MSDKLQKITIADVAKLRKLSIETFDDTFGPFNKKKYLDEYYRSAYNEKQLTAEINNPGTDFEFLFHDNQLAGYLKLNVNAAQSEPEGPTTLEIERIYIRKGFKRQGLGSKLMNYAIGQAQQQNKTTIWLGVWEHNYPAQKFYTKQGFKQFSSHTFKLGEDLQTDLLMKKKI